MVHLYRVKTALTMVADVKSQVVDACKFLKGKLFVHLYNKQARYSE